MTREAATGRRSSRRSSRAGDVGRPFVFSRGPAFPPRRRAPLADFTESSRWPWRAPRRTTAERLARGIVEARCRASGAASSATSTTARSSGSSRCRSSCAWPRGAPGDPLRRACSSAPGTSSTSRWRSSDELARGLHPGVLTDRGLVAALSRSRTGRPPGGDRGAPDEGFDAALEAALYFVVAESLTNAAKHADASSARVELSTTDDLIAVAVHDNGCGGANLTAGSGLRGLADRVEALGGRLDVRSPVGAGTVVRAQLPLRHETPGAAPGAAMADRGFRTPFGWVPPGKAERMDAPERRASDREPESDLEVVVVGAGQAGLAIGYFLARHGTAASDPRAATRSPRPGGTAGTR